MSLVLLLQAGCYHSVTHAGQPSGATQTRTSWNFFWGIVDASFDVHECDSGVAYLDAWSPWWGFIPTWLTLGIISPQKIEYACSAGPKQVPSYPPMGYPPPQAYPPAQPYYPPQSYAPPQGQIPPQGIAPPPAPAPVAAPASRDTPKADAKDDDDASEADDQDSDEAAAKAKPKHKAKAKKPKKKSK